MDQLRKQLPVKARAVLDDLWQDMDTMKALKLALSNRQLTIAQVSVASARDFGDVRENRGQINESMWFLKFLKYNHQECDKERQAKQLK